jgi:hypothetical protein
LVAVVLAALLATVLIQAPASALAPTLHWNPVTNATSYRVQLSVSPSFTPTLYNQTTVNTNFVPYNALPTGTIYWRVAAIDPSGQGDFADSEFTRTLDGPDLFSPADDPGGSSPLAFPATPIRFTWETLDYANSYELQVDDANDFVGATTVKTDASSYTLPETKDPGQNFFWRVRGATDAGGSGTLSEWSEVFEFRT